MKLFALVVALFALPSFSFAYGETSSSVSRSSFTLTNDTTVSIRPTSGTPVSLESVIVSSVSAGGTVTLYDSNGTATNRIGIINTNVANQFFYNVKLSSGITYTTSNNTGGVTIIYTPR